MSNKITNAYCRLCCRHTNHSIIFEAEEGYSNDDVDGKIVRTIIECRWCESVSYQVIDHDYSMTYLDEDGDWNYAISVEQYPQYLSGHRSIDDWALPKSIRAIYKESINALKSDCKLLAWAWFRAVIEAICIDKKIGRGNLESKINALARAWLITKKECERLHSVRFLGNDSIHEILTPSSDQLKVVLTIIENILSNLYIIDDHIEGKLKWPISEYQCFLTELSKLIKNVAEDEECPLVHMFGRDVRRIKENLSEFEKKLIEDISSGSFTGLALWNLKPYQSWKGNVQHYRIAVEVVF